MSEPVTHCSEHLQIKLTEENVALRDKSQCHQDELRGLREMEKMEKRKGSSAVLFCVLLYFSLCLFACFGLA